MRGLSSFAAIAVTLVAYGASGSAASYTSTTSTLSSEDLANRPTSNETIALLPAIYWETDTNDLCHLQPNKTCQVFYAEHSDSSREGRVAQIGFSLVYPTVVLDHSSYVTSVECATNDSMVIEVSTKEAYQYLTKEWAPYAADTPDFLAVMGYFPTCSPSFDLGERSVHLVHDFTFNSIGNQYLVHCVVEHQALGQVVETGDILIGKYVPDPVNPTKTRRALHEREPGFWSGIGSGIETIGSSIASAVVGAVGAVETGAGDALAAAENGVTLSDSFSMSINQTACDVATPFHGKMGKSIYNGTSLQIYCVECAMQVQANFGVSASFGIEGFTAGKITFNGNLFMSASLGIASQMTNLRVQIKQFTEVIWQQGDPETSVSGVFQFGPWVELDLSAVLAVGAVGQVEAGFQLDWKDARFELDIMDLGNTSASGWEPEFTPILDMNGEITLSITFGIPVSLNFGLYIDIFGEKIEKGIRVQNIPSIRFGITESFDLEYDNATESLHGSLGPAVNCSGAILSFTVQNDLVAGVIVSAGVVNTLSYTLDHYQFFGMEYCWDHGLFIDPTSPAAQPKKVVSTISGPAATISAPATLENGTLAIASLGASLLASDADFVPTMSMQSLSARANTYVGLSHVAKRHDHRAFHKDHKSQTRPRSTSATPTASPEPYQRRRSAMAKR